MPTVNTARCATAFEPGFGGKITRLHGMRFEKRNRQKRNQRGLVHLLWRAIDRIAPAPVNGIERILVPIHFQQQIRRRRALQLENFMNQFASHVRFITR